MHKDFDNWNEIKKKTHLNNKPISFKEREVWWCKLGVNIGDEEDGKGENKTRPVLIIKRLSSNLLVVLPLSTSHKQKHYYHQFKFKGQTQSVILSQIKAIDKKRLTSRFGSITEKDFEIIKEKAKNMIF